MVSLVWHGIWYGQMGMAWYVVWPDGHGKVWPGGHGMEKSYGLAGMA